MQIKRRKYHSHICLKDVFRTNTQKIKKEHETLVHYRIRTRKKRKITLAWYILGLRNRINYKRKMAKWIHLHRKLCITTHHQLYHQIYAKNGFRPSKIQRKTPIVTGKRDRKSTRLNSSHITRSRMPSSA